MSQAIAEQDAAKKAKENPDSFQENLEAVVVAIILALIIRHYAMEAFVIPTGSMAPTLLGEHYELTCQNCGNNWQCNQMEGRDFSVRCDLCREELNCDAPYAEEKVATTFNLAFNTTPRHGGNKILVNKFVYKFKDPERFDVIVFKNPKEPARNYIKRLIGLPGERLKIEHGDLFIDGERVVKNPDVQGTLWRKVYDQEYPSAKDTPEPWNPDSPQRWAIRRRGEGGEAQLKDLKLSGVADEAFIAGPGPRATRIEYQREIRDFSGYNPHWSAGRLTNGSTNGDSVVVDLKTSFEVIPAGEAGAITVELQENGVPLVLSLPVGKGDAALSRRAVGSRSQVQVKGEGGALTPREANRVEFAWADRQARVLVNGEEVLSWKDPEGKLSPSQSGVAFTAPEAGAVFQDVELARDLFYYYDVGGLLTAFGSKWDEDKNEIAIPEGSFVVLGDNCRNSNDSRSWGFVDESHMVGRAFIVFWPLEGIRLIR